MMLDSDTIKLIIMDVSQGIKPKDSKRLAYGTDELIQYARSYKWFEQQKIEHPNGFISDPRE